MSFFSKKTPPQEALADNSLIIKTMQDDLDAINGIVHQNTAPSKKQEQQSTQNSDFPVAAAQDNTTAAKIQSPFTSPEPVLIKKTPAPIKEGVKKETPVATKTDDLLKEDSDRFKKREQAPRETVQPALISKVGVPIAALVALIVVGGGYYFVKSRSVDTSLETEAVVVPMPPVNDEADSVLFSINTPNYLPLDTVDTTPNTIQLLLLKTAEDAAPFSTEQPLEFFITDKDNNPLSFAKFATLSGMTLSQSVIDTLNGKFSLFIYTENQTPHISIVIEAKDADSARAVLKQKESFLTHDLSPLFLGDAPTKTDGSFNDGSYNDIPTRYINIHPETALSIDYSIADNSVIISTSRQTHHSVIDTILANTQE